MAAPSSWKAWRWVSVAWARMGTEVGPPRRGRGQLHDAVHHGYGHCGANRRRLTGIYAIRPWRGRRNCPHARRFRVRGAGGPHQASAFLAAVAGMPEVPVDDRRWPPYAATHYGAA